MPWLGAVCGEKCDPLESFRALMSLASWITFWRGLLVPINTVWISDPPRFVIPRNIVLCLSLERCNWSSGFQIWWYHTFIKCLWLVRVNYVFSLWQKLLKMSCVYFKPLMWSSGAALWQVCSAGPGLLCQRVSGRIFPATNIFQWRTSSCLWYFVHNGEVNSWK